MSEEEAKMQDDGTSKTKFQEGLDQLAAKAAESYRLAEDRKMRLKALNLACVGTLPPALGRQDQSPEILKRAKEYYDFLRGDRNEK